MKRSTLILIFISIFFKNYAQKFKFKFDDDIIFNDKTPIAKVEGETRKLSAIVDLTFKTLGGKILFTVKSKRSDLVIPDDAGLGYYNRDWTEVNFPELNKTIKIENEIFRTKKGVSKFFLDEVEIPFLKDSTLNAAAIDAFASKKDVSGEIDKMLADAQNFEDATVKYLDGNKSRDLTKPVTLLPITQNNNGIVASVTYSILQDNIEIGFLVKNIRTYSGTSITNTSYSVYKKLDKVFAYNNKSLDKAFLAILGDATGFPTVYTLNDKKKYQFKTAAGQALTPEALAQYLVKEKYL